MRQKLTAKKLRFKSLYKILVLGLTSKTKKTYSSPISLQLTKLASKQMLKAMAWDLAFVRRLHTLFKAV